MAANVLNVPNKTGRTEKPSRHLFPQIELLRAKQSWAASVHSGQATGLRLPLSRGVQGRNVSLTELTWAACMVSQAALEVFQWRCTLMSRLIPPVSTG